MAHDSTVAGATSTHQSAEDSSATEAALTTEERERLVAFAYLGRPDAPIYVAIMRLFASSLLAEWSAKDVAEGLAVRGIHVSVESIDDKLKRLAATKNLLPSPREVRAASIAEYQRQAARYQLSKIGSQIQRDVDAVLSAAEGAREVSRELLALIARGLGELAEISTRDKEDADVNDVAERVSTLFLQFSEFASSIADFYAYVGSVVSRFDLDSEEFDGFKNLLLDYLETVVNEVATFTPTVERALDRLWPTLPVVLQVLDRHGADFRALQEATGGLDRARGRKIGDWEELRRWFSDGEAGSGAYQLRAAATRAVGALLANLKRINSTSTKATSQRRDLLKLAGWFERSTSEEAHALFNAAFGIYGARHLGISLGEDGTVDPDLVPSTTPWWNAPTAPVPISLRDRGDRTARGRSSRAETYQAQKQRLLADRARQEQERRAAMDELAAAAAHLEAVRLSGPAMRLMIELFVSATGAAQLATSPTTFTAGTSTVANSSVQLTARAAQGRNTVVRSAVGDMTFHNVTVTVVPAEALPVTAAQRTGA